MSIAHLNFNFYPKKLILWQVMFILCSSPPATTLWICYWQRYSSFLSDSIYEKWIVGYNAAGHTVSFHFVEVNFAGVPNVNDRDRLYWIGTNLDLSDEDVDFLYFCSQGFTPICRLPGFPSGKQEDYGEKEERLVQNY